MPTNIELFAGAGGLALGLEQSGFTNIAVAELDKTACQTLKVNRPNWNVIEGDLSKIMEQEGLNAHLKQALPVGTLDLLSGGYPCQTFSVAGNQAGLGDIRGTLFETYAKVLAEFKPKMFLVENVKGLVKHDHGRTLKTMMNTFKQLGYSVAYQVLNANDYGVAQKRERMILVGTRTDLPDDYLFPVPHDYNPVLRDALKDVPNSVGVTYSANKYAILAQVPAGGNWHDLPDKVAAGYLGKAYYNRKGGMTNFARRLSWDKPSLTLTTSPNQKMTERCHPDETRPLTAREYARVQSFPDTWSFEGSITNIYKQIGNAVPVKLAEAVGTSLIDYLKATIK